MDWFSKNFPSLAKLVSILGKTAQRPTGSRARRPGRRSTTSTTTGLGDAAQSGILTLDDHPMPVTEEPAYVDPGQVQEAFLDLAPSGIDQDALTERPGEATPSTLAEPFSWPASSPGGAGNGANGIWEANSSRNSRHNSKHKYDANV